MLNYVGGVRVEKMLVWWFPEKSGWMWRCWWKRGDSPAWPAASSGLGRLMRWRCQLPREGSRRKQTAGNSKTVTAGSASRVRCKVYFVKHKERTFNKIRSPNDLGDFTLLVQEKSHSRTCLSSPWLSGSPFLWFLFFPGTTWKGVH